MFLVYMGNTFFGNTPSKKIITAMKKCFPKIHSVHIDEHLDLPFEASYVISDEYLIGIYELEDMNGNMVKVVSTFHEQEEASVWINKYIADKLLLRNPDNVELFDILPDKFTLRLGNYAPIEYEMICDDIAMNRDLPFALTYEGFLTYLNRDDKRSNNNDINKTTRMLSEELVWG